jgi:DNA primase
MSDNDDIQNVKDGLDLERIISSQASDWVDEGGVSGRKGRCTHPVHGHTGDGDNAGNLIVTEEGWYCYSHESGGDVLDWISIEEGFTNCRDPHPDGDDFVEVLNIAADRAGVELWDKDRDFSDLPDQQKAELELAEIIEHLHAELGTLVGDMTVRGKIKQDRGFSDADIDNAKIGWIDDQVYADLLHEFGNETLQRTGFQKTDGSQFVSGRIIYPYMKQGRPRYWTGRVTEESMFEDAKYRKPEGRCDLEQPVHVVRPPDETPSPGLWVTEGIQDAISTASEGGVKALTAVATNPSGVQRQQLYSAARSAERVVVCFDSDDSGVSKSMDMALDLMDQGVQVEIASVPEGDDPNDFFKNGGDFGDIQPEPAVEKIVTERGSGDVVLDKICSTLTDETPRCDRVINALNGMTGIRKRTLRKKVRESSRRETSSGWQEPVSVRKRGRTDVTFILTYNDGTEIELDAIGSRESYNRFRTKFANKFNHIPTHSRQEFEEMVNRWFEDLMVEEPDPLSLEEQVKETVCSKIEGSRAVPDRTRLSVVGDGYVAYYNDGREIAVPNDVVRDWLEDYDKSLRQHSEYLSPILAGSSKLLSIGERQKRLWRFSVDAINDQGYNVPDPEQFEDEKTDEEAVAKDVAEA